jgi:hypothetical protein
VTTLFDIESRNLYEKVVDKHKGTIMMYDYDVKNIRGTVCASDFDYHMADVLCTKLGYKYGIEWGRSRDMQQNENQQ